MTVLPKPRRSGGRTGGPSRSVQLIAKISPPSRHPTSTRPASDDSAPYLPALVASSWRARPTAWAAAPISPHFGPFTALLLPSHAAHSASGAHPPTSVP